MIFGKIFLEKDWDVNEVQQLLKTYAIGYVQGFFQSRFKNRAKIRELRQIETYINTSYNIKINIKDIILKILLNIRLNTDGTIDIRDYKYNNVKLSLFYREITFGALTSPKSEIINKALICAIRMMRIKKYYGC